MHLVEQFQQLWMKQVKLSETSEVSLVVITEAFQKCMFFTPSFSSSEIYRSILKPAQWLSVQRAVSRSDVLYFLGFSEVRERFEEAAALWSAFYRVMLRHHRQHTIESFSQPRWDLGHVDFYECDVIADWYYFFLTAWYSKITLAKYSWPSKCLLIIGRVLVFLLYLHNFLWK